MRYLTDERQTLVPHLPGASTLHGTPLCFLRWAPTMLKDAWIFLISMWLVSLAFSEVGTWIRMELATTVNQTSGLGSYCAYCGEHLR